MQKFKALFIFYFFFTSTHGYSVNIPIMVSLLIFLEVFQKSEILKNAVSGRWCYRRPWVAFTINFTTNLSYLTPQCNAFRMTIIC